jgi:hypothetical protein
MNPLFNKIFPNKYTFYLFLLIVFHVLVNFIFAIINTTPPTWDSAGHLVLSFIFSDKLVLFFKSQATVATLFGISTYYPPFVHMLGALFILLFGRSYEIPLYLVGTGFLVVSILFLYKIILLKFPNNYKLAFLVTLIFSLFPQIWEQSRHFHLDIPLCGLLLSSFYFLLRSDSLKNMKYALLFFITFSLVQLTKWYGFIYLVIPFIYEVFLKGIFEGNTKSKTFVLNRKLFINLVIGIMLVSLIALPWYIINFQSILNTTAVSLTSDADDPTVIISLYNFVHYMRMMMSHQIGFLSLILLGFSSVYLFFKDKKLSLYLLVSFLFPYIIFTFIQNKDLRYIMPLAPMVAFIIGYFLVKLRIIFVKSYLYYLALLFVFFSFNQFIALNGIYKVFGYLMSGPYAYYWERYPTAYAYTTKDWQGETILKDIAKYASLESDLIGDYKVLELSDNRFYSLASFDMYKMQNKFYDMILKVPYNQSGVLSEEELTTYLSDVSFALIPLDPGPPGLRNIQILNQLKNYFVSDQNVTFDLVGEYKLPDKNILYLYKRKNFDSISTASLSKTNLVVKVADVLYLDSTNLGVPSYTVHFFDNAGRDIKREFGGDGISQNVLSLEDIKMFRIDLPREQLNLSDLRGWAFRDMHFVSLDNYDYTDYVFSLGKIRPVETSTSLPSTVVSYKEDTIEISNFNKAESTYIAYATLGWNWKEFNIQDNSRELKLPASDLLRVEITNANIYVTGFPKNWGFFKCYEGRALCFYPASKSF